MPGLEMLLLLVLGVVSVARGQDDSDAPYIELEEVWGKMVVKAGVAQEVRCSVSNPLPEGGAILWSIDETPVDNPNRVELDQEGKESQAFRIVPRVEDDKKALSCSYLQDGKILAEDSVQLVVRLLDLPDQVNTDLVKEGDSLDLQVGAQIYPAPGPKSVWWHVVGPNKETVTRLYPGEKDLQGTYSALQAQDLGGHRYLYRLSISAVGRAEAESSHFLVVHHGDRNLTVVFNIAMRMQDGDDGSFSDDDGDKADNVTSVEALGLGIWIIVAILALCILLVLVYCCFMRRKNGKRRESKDRTYTAVRQSDKREPA